MKNQDLIERIRAAFAEVPFPGDDDLAGVSHGDEPAAVRRDFAGKDNWQMLDARFLDQAPEGWATALAFFSPAAYRFYLPAYLIADIRGELSAVDPSFSLCWAFREPTSSRRIAAAWGGGTVREHAAERFSTFDSVQCKVILAYLRWKQSSDAMDDLIERAIDNYWTTRAPESPD